MLIRTLLATALAGLVALPALAQDDLVAAGEKVFKKCAACHAVGEGAKDRVGPSLNGLIGRTAGTEEGFKYSPAMVKAGESGIVWGPDTLDTYLADPKADVPGNKMAFPGLKNEDDRKAVIAYIQSKCCS
ncbi:MAG: cytochrome c family protein [Amaricoccus sp.]|uniref:c-type cytochrome n=1 Tax=Amaricoccus sp. TaxID=1872485 RepID=UPI0039E57672